MKRFIEIAVQSPDSAHAALAAGANRVELCAALQATGGITASHATLRKTVETARDFPNTAVHALIRPRPGGFVYSPDEVQLMMADIRHAIDCGVDGVVIGASLPDGNLDYSTLEALVSTAQGTTIVLHRAFDVIPHVQTPRIRDDFRKLSDLGISAVLTSAGAPTVPEGIAHLSSLIEHGHEVGITILAGGGLTPSNIEEVLGALPHLRAVHASCSGKKAAGAVGPGGGQSEYTDLDHPTVHHFIHAVRSSGGY